MEGQNLSLHSNIVRISNRHSSLRVHTRIFPVNYAVYLINILPIIKKESSTIIFSFCFAVLDAF